MTRVRAYRRKGKFVRSYNRGVNWLRRTTGSEVHPSMKPFMTSVRSRRALAVSLKDLRD